jgi:sulfur carrier protein ThiS
MRMKVKLFGMLSQKIPGYQHSQGIEVEIPEGATVRDLLDCLEISESQGAVVAVEGRLLKADDKVWGEAPVHVLQPLPGG